MTKTFEMIIAEYIKGTPLCEDMLSNPEFMEQLAIALKGMEDYKDALQELA